MSKLIYLASPYSSPDPAVIADRVAKTQDAAARLIQAGHTVFSPIVYSHPLADLVKFDPQNKPEGEMSEWMKFDLEMLDKADELWVLALDGSTESKGVGVERRFAIERKKSVAVVMYPSLIVLHVVEGATTTPEPAKVDPLPERMVIGLTGKARAGKDTVGEYLVKHHGFVRVSFADKVREAALALNPMIGILFNTGTRLHDIVKDLGWEKAKENPNVRQLLQRLGTEVGRNLFGENCWVEAVDRDLQKHQPKRIVFTDVRFDNEAEYVRELGGEVWNVSRPDAAPVSDHASEQGLSKSVDDIVVNQHSLADLYEQVARMLKRFRKYE